MIPRLSLYPALKSGGFTLREAAYAVGYLFFFEAGCLRKAVLLLLLNYRWLLGRLVYSGQTEI
jgi:hypothetical protein